MTRLPTAHERPPRRASDAEGARNRSAHARANRLDPAR